MLWVLRMRFLDFARNDEIVAIVLCNMRFLDCAPNGEFWCKKRTTFHCGSFKFIAFGNSLRCQKVTPAQRAAQQQMRNKYFGKPVNEGEQSYEEQQRTQNKRVNDHTTENGFLFDHGEESAWAFINICESNGYDIGSSVVNEAVQGILFHSRPDFKTNSPAVQAVQISDSMAFIQDDYQQFAIFGKCLKLKLKRNF